MLIGKNVEIKPIMQDMYPLCAEWFSDPSYMGNFYNIFPQTNESIHELVESCIKTGGGAYLIWDREKKEPVGTIGYFNPFTFSPAFSGLEIWYQVHHHHRGRRIATQAASLLINHLFNAKRPPVNRIQATVVLENDASRKVLEHAGMSKEGIMRGVWFLHGEYRDEYIYSILRSDWVNESEYSKEHEF